MTRLAALVLSGVGVGHPCSGRCPGDLTDAGPVGRLVHGGKRCDAGRETRGIRCLVLELLPGEAPWVTLISMLSDMHGRGKDGGHARIPGRGTNGRGMFFVVVMVAVVSR